MMKKSLSLLVAIFCATQLVLGASNRKSPPAAGKRQLLTSEQIAERLNAAPLSHDQIMELLSSQEPSRKEPIFKDFYADELERNAFAVPANCFHSVLFLRRRLCEMLDMARDGSQAHDNLSQFCWGAHRAVVAYCADKMDPADVPRPSPPEFGLFKEVAARNPNIDRLSREALIEALAAEQVPVERVYLLLSLAAEKQTKLVDGLTVQDFFNLNQFSLDRCKRDALQRRGQFCSKVAPSQVTPANNHLNNLARFCRASLELTARYCDLLKAQDPHLADKFDPSLTDGHVKYVDSLQE